jgi:hypothetical protein
VLYKKKNRTAPVGGGGVPAVRGCSNGMAQRCVCVRGWVGGAGPKTAPGGARLLNNSAWGMQWHCRGYGTKHVVAIANCKWGVRRGCGPLVPQQALGVQSPQSPEVVVLVKNFTSSYIF